MVPCERVFHNPDCSSLRMRMTMETTWRRRRRKKKMEVCSLIVLSRSLITEQMMVRLYFESVKSGFNLKICVRCGCCCSFSG